MTYTIEIHYNGRWHWTIYKDGMPKVGDNADNAGAAYIAAARALREAGSDLGYAEVA